MITLRILMFAGAAAGLLLTALFGFLASQEDAPFLVVAVAAFGLYGLGSLTLAILAGRRHPALRWVIVAFHVLALAYLLFAAGMRPEPPPGQPDPAGAFNGLCGWFTITCLVLVSVGPSGRYFTRPAEQSLPPAPPAAWPTPGGQGPRPLP